MILVNDFQTFVLTSERNPLIMKSVLIFWSCVLGIKLLLAFASFYHSQQAVEEIAPTSYNIVDSTKQITFEKQIKGFKSSQKAQLSK